MSIFAKILMTFAIIILVGMLLQLFVLTLRLDTDEQKLKSGEITAEEAISEAEIAHSLVRIMLTLMLSLIIAGIAFIIDNSRKISNDLDELPEQIPVNDKEEDERRKK